MTWGPRRDEEPTTQHGWPWLGLLPNNKKKLKKSLPRIDCELGKLQIQVDILIFLWLLLETRITFSLLLIRSQPACGPSIAERQAPLQDAPVLLV